MVHAVITWLGQVGSGGESSPLSSESVYSEILRVLQLGIAAGVFYLIQKMREGHKASDETHSSILNDIKEVRQLIKDMRTERINEIAELRSELQNRTPQ